MPPIPTQFADRARAAFLGLALGDAYGRPLEFISGRAVRTTPAGPGHDFRWTDDTHMSMYLAQAMLEHGPGPVDADAFAVAVGTQFVAWKQDPLTPSTAPGNTCMAGTQRWAESNDWRTSGVEHSDGCGAVMRIAPLAMAWTGEQLTAAARVQAMLTHGHPNAAEAAAVACWILRELLTGGTLDAALVTRAARRSARRRFTEGGPTVSAALTAAVSESGRQDSAWLDEAAIPAGDGGWRSPSALGLALAAALRWGRTADGDITTETFRRTVDKAARINGDSDSVACLAGMFLAAAGGTEVLPPDWLAVIPARARIEQLASEVSTMGQLRATDGSPGRGRTVLPPAPETWLVIADLHGHAMHLDALLRHADAALGDQYITVTLGDYVDNGPDVPGLMDRLVALRNQRPGRFVPIMGNHDLACLRALGWPDGTPDPVWFARMKRRYWNQGAGTDSAYGAHSASALRARMPSAHQAFLRALPWFHDTGEYLFVHAGMEVGPLAPQRRRLAHKLLPETHEHLPPQLRDKRLCSTSDERWDRVVVSSHTKQPAAHPGSTARGPQHVMTDMRICLSGEVDHTGVLYAIELPARRVWKVDPHGAVSRS